MTEDPRCCGSGTCIIDDQGHCWCGQQWNGQRMCTPVLTPVAPSQQLGSDGTAPEAPADADAHPAASAARRLLGLAVLALPLAMLLPPPAQAQTQTQAESKGLSQRQGQPFTATEAKALQAVVQGQLAAFAAGDAARAYAYASAAIQQQFGDAARFLAMVQAAYPMIIKPRSVAFRLPERAQGTVVQAVQLLDAEGRAWLATYQLVAQPGGGWRIGGCVVTADEQRLST